MNPEKLSRVAQYNQEQEKFKEMQEKVQQTLVDVIQEVAGDMGVFVKQEDVFRRVMENLSWDMDPESWEANVDDIREFAINPLGLKGLVETTEDGNIRALPRQETLH